MGTMRVIGGEFRSPRLKTLPGLSLRPTPDRLRETLFNILSPVIEGSVFVDAYAGTGAVGIEALSRGARHATFIEKNRQALYRHQGAFVDYVIKAREHAHTLCGDTPRELVGKPALPHPCLADDRGRHRPPVAPHDAGE